MASSNGKAGAGAEKITISSVGYLQKTLTIKEGNGGLLIFLESANYMLNSIQVTGWSAGKKDKQLNLAQSVGVLTPRDLSRNSGLSLENSLNLVPGVTMQSRSSFGGQRISIRGYGNNTNFNGRVCRCISTIFLLRMPRVLPSWMISISPPGQRDGIQGSAVQPVWKRDSRCGQSFDSQAPV